MQRQHRSGRANQLAGLQVGKGESVSSLRVETLRLCWLEAFIEVAETENISEAALNLGYDQSTASRYIQRLEKWLGKKLIEPGKVSDLENARISIGLTDEGLEFREIAVAAVDALVGSRTEAASRADLLGEMAVMLGKMRAALDGMRNPRIAEAQPNVEAMEALFELMVSDTEVEAPIDALKNINKSTRRFFGMFERRNRKLPKATSGDEFDAEFFLKLAAEQEAQRK